VIEDTFSDNETSCQRAFLLASLLLSALENLFEALHIIMIVPTNRASRNLKTFLNSKVDTTVCNDDVPSLAEGGNDRRDGRKRLRISDSSLGA
jgi:hypothetical protein